MGMNNILSVLAVAVALGADAFSVALGLGLSGVSRNFKVRFVGTVAVFHVIMPLLGLYIGLTAGNILGRWAAIIGAVVLAFIGFQMLRKGLEDEERSNMDGARTKLASQKAEAARGMSGWAAIAVLALSVSVDALAVGFGLGTTQVPIVYTVVTMGSVAGIMTGLGWIGAKYSSEILGRRAQAVGGIILTILAIKMLL